MLIRSSQYSTAEVWSQPDCDACTQAKRLLERAAIPYTENILGENATKEDLITKVPSARSVPQIFLNGAYVGGLPELRKLLDDNYQRATMEQRV